LVGLGQVIAEMTKMTMAQPASPAAIQVASAFPGDSGFESSWNAPNDSSFCLFVELSLVDIVHVSDLLVRSVADGSAKSRPATQPYRSVAGTALTSSNVYKSASFRPVGPDFDSDVAVTST
jgi:hypothetical protein